MEILTSRTSNNGLAFVNGRVYTVEESRPWISAFIVSADGHFAALGNDHEIRAQALEANLIIFDLKGHFVMPGIHDAHTHLILGPAQQMQENDIGYDANDRTLSEKIKHSSSSCAYTRTYGDWIVANFYMGINFPDNKPDRKYLDEAFPNIPVIVREVSCHHVLLNTEGLKRAGYDLNESDPHGGKFIRRENGEITGELVEMATRKAWTNIPQPALAHIKRTLLWAMDTCLRFGITSAQEASANTVYLAALRELEAEGKLNMHLHTHIVCAPEIYAQEPRDSLLALLEVADTFKSQHVHTNFVKFWMDGAPLPPHFTQCGLTAKGEVDEEKILVDEKFFRDAMRKYDARGMTVKIHCCGQGSVRRTLDVVEDVRRENPNGPRHEIAHCNTVHSDDLQRMIELRMTAEMSPAVFHRDDLIGHSPDLFKWPFTEILNGGGMITFGSDWIVPENPSLFAPLAAIVDQIGEKVNVPRDSNKTVRQKGAEALCRAITLGGAEAVGRADVTGSIAVGKQATFIIMSQDLSKGEFEGAEVLQTWFEGKMVYTADRLGKPFL